MVLLLWSPNADGLRVGGPLDASTPYLTDARLADGAYALRFLSRFAHQFDVLRVLRVAIGAGSGFNPARDVEDGLLIRYAAEAIARGHIRVGEVLPARFAAYFDPRDPVASRLGFPVCVPDIAAGQAVLRTLGESEGGEATLQAVLRHPAGSEWMLGRAANAQGPGLVALCAELLALRALLLLPLSPTGRTMRLVWALRPSLQADSVAPQAPPPPRARAPSPPPPPPPPPAQSELPPAETEPSQQGDTLIEAAETGAPFCEECARLAAMSEPPPDVLPPPAPADSPQATALQEAAASGAPFCEECARAEAMADA